MTNLVSPALVIPAELKPADGRFGCGGWTAYLDGDRLALTGEGTRIDGLRALCAAAWAIADADGHGRVTPESTRQAVQSLDAAPR